MVDDKHPGERKRHASMGALVLSALLGTLALPGCSTADDEVCPGDTALVIRVVDRDTGLPLELAQLFEGGAELQSIDGARLCSAFTDAGTPPPDGAALCSAEWSFFFGPNSAGHIGDGSHQIVVSAPSHASATFALMAKVDGDCVHAVSVSSPGGEAALGEMDININLIVSLAPQ